MGRLRSDPVQLTRAAPDGGVDLPGYSGAMALTTIIAGCDLSQPSDQALERAIGIALLHRAKIVLVHAQASEAPVTEVDNALLSQLGEVSAAIRAEEAARLAGKLAEIQGLGLRAAVSCTGSDRRRPTGRAARCGPRPGPRRARPPGLRRRVECAARRRSRARSAGG